MANVEINDLTLKATPVDSDEIEIQESAGGASFKATRTTILGIGTDTQAHSAVLDATTASFLTTDETKLDGIEIDATADQTGAEIKAAYEAEADTNAYTDAEKTKLAGVAAGAEVNTVDSVNTKTGVVVIDPDDLVDIATTNKFTTAAEITKLTNIEALADVTATHETSHSDVVVDGDIGSTVQAYDAGLASIAGLTTTADKMIYTTAADTYSVIDLTSAGRALLDDADVSAQRTTLGLEIGADVQAYDVDTAKTDVAQEYTATQNFNATTLTDGANISWDASANQVASVTLAGNRTLDNPTNMVDGATYILTVKQDATGTRTLAYGTAYKWAGGTAPTLTTDASAVDIITFVCDGTSMYGVETLDFS